MGRDVDLSGLERDWECLRGMCDYRIDWDISRGVLGWGEMGKI